MIDIKKAVVLVSIGLTLATPAFALSLPQVRQEVKEVKQNLREESREKISTKPGMLQRAQNLLGKAAIASGQVTAKSGTALTVVSDGKTSTVNTDANTQFRFRFWGKGNLDAIAVGHMVNVIGKWQDDAHTSILARQVRDLSLQKRFGVFVGEVKSLLSNGWVMSTVSAKRADQTVTVSASTKFVNRKEQSISQSDITVGQKVRVKGLWDSEANTVTEVTQVKDFSLPVVVKPTP